MSIEDSTLPVNTFHARMYWSAVPPPVARMLCCHGHHARAFTAAVCWEKVWLGALQPVAVENGSHTFTVLSFPPLAKSRPVGDQRSPQTSRLCAFTSCVATGWGSRMS